VHSEVACWLYTGERQSAVIRSRGVQILLKQDLGYFDRFAGSGVFVSQISSDVLSVHHTLSEKVNLKFQDTCKLLFTENESFVVVEFSSFNPSVKLVHRIWNYEENIQA
jgi:hypothetical protein